MTLWDMFNLVKYVTNKDFSGNIVTPERFNDLIKVASVDHFRNKYGLPEQYEAGRPIPKEFIDITLKNTDDMKAFNTPLFDQSVVNGIFDYPTNYAHRNVFAYNYVKTINSVANILPCPIEVLREAEFAARNGNYTKRPTIQNPTCVLRSDGVHIRPLTIALIDVFYYRWPAIPEFSYNLEDGYITFDVAGSVELDWPEDEKIVIMRRCLEYIGVNLREGALVGYVNAKLKEG